MKFFTAIVLVALVAFVSAAPQEVQKLEAVKEAEPVNANDQDAVNAARGKRGLVLSAYSAPLTAAVPVAAAAAPVAYTYSAGLPYAYSAYSAYSPYYTYPAAAAAYYV